METIEHFLDNTKNNNLPNNILSSYKYFDYEYPEVFKLDLNLLLDKVYTDIKITTTQKVRLEQSEFKKNLLDLYDGKCIITNNDCEKELNACHIIPVKDGGDYSCNNGLILECNLHATFDDFLWSINPKTMKIEINSNKNIGSIKKYEGKKLNMDMNPFLYSNLEWHYEKFNQ